MPNPDDNNNKKENDQSVDSSLLTKPAVIVCWLVLCILAVLFEKTQVALFLGFLFILTALSYCWSRLALKHVRFTLDADHRGVFPGQEFTLTRSIENGKALPLIWVEISEHCEADDPAAPPPASIVSHECYDGSNGAKAYVYERLYTLSLVPWYGHVSFPDIWTARRRGMMEIGASLVRSGDGFGLCATGKLFEPSAPERIVVFPALVPVSVGSIVNDMWDTRSRTSGYLEDRSVIKSVRAYQAGDPVRNINTRLLAQGQSLKTNIYEIVTPDTILFVLDPGSFLSAKRDLFEEALSVTASLIWALSHRGLAVSLLAPGSDWYPETCTVPSCAEAGRYEMLALLAAASAKDGPIRGAPPDLAEDAGRIFYVAAGLSSVTAPALLGLLPAHKTRILTPDVWNAYCRIGKAV